MAKKYWVELGDMVVEMDTIIKLMKKYDGGNKWNVKNIVVVINALMQKMKAIQLVFGPIK